MVVQNIIKGGELKMILLKNIFLMLSCLKKKPLIALPYQSNKNDVGLKIEGI